MTIPPVDLPPLEPRYADGPAYLGPTTFCRVPQLSTPDQLDRVKPDIAIVGAPWDDGVTYRPGARFGPRAVRTASYQNPEWHLELEVAPLDVLRVIDYGDAMCMPGMAEASHAAIRERVGDVAQRKIIPMVIGGDHSITWPSATAVAAAYEPGSVGIVHFDAHADTGDNQWGNLYSHGSPMRRLIEFGRRSRTQFRSGGAARLLASERNLRLDARAGHALASHGRAARPGSRGGRRRSDC